MLWKRRDMGSDPVRPIYVESDIPVIDDCVNVAIPVTAYKRLVDWCSMGRTMDNVLSCLADASRDEDRTHMAYEEMEALRKALEAVHGAVREHYIRLPHTQTGGRS